MMLMTGCLTCGVCTPHAQPFTGRSSTVAKVPPCRKPLFDARMHPVTGFRPLFNVPVFGLLIGLALWRRGDAALHKRLTLVAMIGTMGPALSRLPTPAGLPQPAFLLTAISSLLAAIVAWNISSRGKPHRVTLWSSGLMLASLLLRVALMGTPLWLRFATAAVSIVR